ncbi:MAG: hypothetical protein LCH37_10620 [Bacteroidetes bacterium]|nr:hypothetical protein [Bacteroidota bacterium]
MKQKINLGLTLFSLIFLLSCGNSQAPSQESIASLPAEASIPVVQVIEKPIPKKEYCFIKVDGLNKKDTSILHLIIKGEKVRGELLFRPHRKPAKTGIIKGTIKGNAIQCEYFYHILTAEESEIQTWELGTKSIVLKKSSGKKQMPKLPFSLSMVDCKTFR